jgi:Uma2 family endonuclease
MAETPIHIEAILLLYQALQDFFRDRADVFIAADVFWYWEEGNPNARRAPDVMAVIGVPRDVERRSFFSWREGGAVPAVIFEMASQNTWREDIEEKYDLYERLGVREYFVFDPEDAYLRPPLQGFRLRQGTYRRMRPDANATLASDLGFRLRGEGRSLRLIDGPTGQPIPTREEKAEQERQRAERLEAELQQLRAQLGQGGEGTGT